MDWSSATSSLLESRNLLKTAHNSIYGIAGRSDTSSLIHKVHSANLITVDGLIVKDRTGSPESSFPVQGFSNLREVYWDPELGLLELKS